MINQYGPAVSRCACREGSRAALVSLALVAVAVLIGCRTTPRADAPLQPPGAVAAVDAYFGSPLTGPTTDVPAAAAAGASGPIVRVRLFALERMPRSAESLDARVRLITTPAASSPIIAAGRLTPHVRVIDLPPDGDVDSGLPGDAGSAAGRQAFMSRLDGAVLPGTTTLFSLVNATPEQAGGRPDFRSIAVLAHRPSADDPRIELALAVYDWVTLPAPPADPDQPAGRKSHLQDTAPHLPRELRHETALLEPIPLERRRLALIIPFRFTTSAPARAGSLTPTAVAAIIDIEPDGGADYPALEAAALAACRAAAQRAHRFAAAPIETHHWPEFDTALAAMAQRPRRRAAMVFLAGQTDARLFQDAALVADELVLEQLAQRTAAVLRALAPSERTRDAVGAALERTALEELHRLMGDQKLSAELSAALLRCAGEAGQRSGSIETVAREMSSVEDMRQRFIAENLIYLEDASPAARVRAHRWLAAQGQVIEGFDPLAPPAERRRALDRALEASAPTTQTAGDPS